MTGVINLLVFIANFILLEETKPRAAAATLEHDGPDETDPLLQESDTVVPPNSDIPLEKVSNRVIQCFVGVSAL